jgi:hypothetical protein
LAENQGAAISSAQLDLAGFGEQFAADQHAADFAGARADKAWRRVAGGR